MMEPGDGFSAAWIRCEILAAEATAKKKPTGEALDTCLYGSGPAFPQVDLVWAEKFHLKERLRRAFLTIQVDQAQTGGARELKSSPLCLMRTELF